MNPPFEVAVTLGEGVRLSEREAGKGVSMVNRQVRYHYAPIWGRDLTVEFDTHPERYDWLIRIVNDSTVPGAAGWHSINVDDQNRVIAEVALNQPFPWTAVLSHEVLEMLSNQSVAGMEIDRSTGLLYAREVCDPVQARLYNMEAGNYPVSDFVTPDWFSADAHPNSTAFKTRDLNPFTIAEGGWAIRWDLDFNDHTIYYGEQRVEMIAEHTRSQIAKLTPELLKLETASGMSA